MEVKAKVKYIKMSPRKVRLVADIVRGLKVGEALNQLRFARKWAARPIAKLLNSAIANAENNFELKKNNLYIKEIRVDEGPTIKRWKPRARGRATPIRKRSSHISLILREIIESGKTKAKKQKISAPVKIESQLKKNEGIKIKDKEKAVPEEKEQGKKIVDPRREGRGQHAPIEKKISGFSSKIFRRKSG